MRFPADECFDERRAVQLRRAGHDVVRVLPFSGLTDLGVVTEAERHDRLLLTHDTDVGALAVRGGRPRTGVILVRAATSDLDEVSRRLSRLVESRARELAGRITVLSDSGVRTRVIG